MIHEATPRSGAYDIRVLGCKVNQYEAQQIRQQLEANGMQAAAAGQAADLIVVHTCAVTSMAVKKSRQAVRQLRKQHPDARLIVTGCAASEDLLSELADVKTRIGPRENWLQAFHEEVKDLALSGTATAGGDHRSLTGFSSHARAFLKIQDGCDIGCTFCIVPRLRRRSRDKPIALVEREARALAAAGHKEVVVSGVSVGLYGRDSGGPTLSDVLRRLLDVPGIERIRLSSLHPRELTDELLAVWSSSPKMMPHIHLPLQAGSDRVLTAMKRGYTASEFLDAVARTRNVLEMPAFNTDVIVGFPGETEADFRDTVRVAREVGFSRMHIFPYSVRPHTRAARMGNAVPPVEAKARCAELRKVAEELTVSFGEQFVRHRSKVLAEEWNSAESTYRGYTERYIPARFAGPKGLQGRIVTVRLEEAGAGAVAATLEN